MKIYLLGWRDGSSRTVICDYDRMVAFTYQGTHVLSREPVIEFDRRVVEALINCSSLFVVEMDV